VYAAVEPAAKPLRNANCEHTEKRKYKKGKTGKVLYLRCESANLGKLHSLRIVRNPKYSRRRYRRRFTNDSEWVNYWVVVAGVRIGSPEVPREL